MVFIIQIIIFIIAFTIRGRALYGKFLEHDGGMDGGNLKYVSVDKKGEETGRYIGFKRQNKEGIFFRIHHERWYHKWLKSLGIASEIKLRDVAFDDKYFIMTDFPGALERAMASADLLPLVKELMAANVSGVYSTADRVWCKIDSDGLGKDEHFYDKHRSLLRQIAFKTQVSDAPDPIVSNSFSPDQSQRRPSQKRNAAAAFGVICVHLALFITGLSGFVPTFIDQIDTIDMVKLVALGLVGGGAGAALWAMFLIKRFGGTAWVCWVLADFVLMGLLGFLLCGIYVAREANMDLPQMAPTVHSQMILKRECVIECEKSCGRRCTKRSHYWYEGDSDCAPETREKNLAEKRAVDYICANHAWLEYFVTTPHWLETKETYRFGLNAERFDEMRTGAQVSIPSYDGALGIQWVDQGAIAAE